MKNFNIMNMGREGNKLLNGFSRYGIMGSVMLFGIMFLLAACGSKGKGVVVDAVAIELDEFGGDSIPLSSISDSVSYITLETTDSNLIGSIKRIGMTDSLIVLLDEKTGQVSSYSIDGKYYGNIGTVGQGEGEYISPECIEVDDSLIYVYDSRRGVAMKYNHAGDFKGSDSVGEGDDFTTITMNGKRCYLLTCYNFPKERAGVFLVDPAENKRERIMECKQGIERYHSWDFFKNGDRVSLASNDYENLIFQWRGDSLAEIVRLEISPVPSQSDLERWGSKDLLKYYNRMTLFDFDRWLIINYWREKGGRVVVFDRKLNKWTVGRRFYDDMDTVKGFVSFPFSPGNILVSAMEGETPDSNPRLQLRYMKE